MFSHQNLSFSTFRLFLVYGYDDMTRLDPYIVQRPSTFKKYVGLRYNPVQRGTCIKRLFWPPLEPKTESCFSPISSCWFIRRIAQV